MVWSRSARMGRREALSEPERANISQECAHGGSGRDTTDRVYRRAAVAPTIRILFGTETGNAEDSANELADVLRQRGWHTDVFDMDDYQPSDLASESLVLVITSTFGNGDPPVNAEALMEHLKDDAPALSGVRYGVCALGDSTYPRYAQCGRDFDRRLAECGAERVIPLQVCDADFERYIPKFRASVIAWLEQHGAAFEGAEAPSGSGATRGASGGKSGFFASMVSSVRSLFGGAPAPAPASAAPRAPAAAPMGWSSKRPFAATLLQRRKLSGEGSGKETMHYALSIAGSDIAFEPGDSFGVHPHNDPAEVDAILAALDLDASAPITVGSAQLPLGQALRERFDLQHVTAALADALIAAGGPSTDAHRADRLEEWRHSRFVAEAISEHPGATLSAHDLAAALRRLQPRLYSVANSPLLTPDEVHITVETLRWEHDGFARTGVASTWLCDRVANGGTVPIHRVPGSHFRPPTDPAADIVCVGPGTGIAPFRAFLQHREARGDTGRTWLFFGHQTQSCDALYADELAGFEQRGVLTRLSCAWSRDQPDKIYVQHRMEAQGESLWSWLDSGAVFYVCGDKQHMAGDVRAALVRIAQAHGGLSPEAAEAWLVDLVEGGRYHVDVY
ncbi:MAG: sulfite reductase (NADPH) flavoprotein alpha-component [Myxococcota bacterium]|jgi:sulfite reductase (NADPH) flavoprotein alpha-component